VKDAWASGKNISEIAKENGITETQLQTKIQAERQEQQKERMDALVSQGVITRAQADQHLSIMKDRTPGEGRGMGAGMQRGGGMMGRNRGI
jgi:transposase-like protein